MSTKSMHASRPPHDSGVVPDVVWSKDVAVAGNLLAGRVIMRIAEEGHQDEFGLRLLGTGIQVNDGQVTVVRKTASTGASMDSVYQNMQWVHGDLDRIRTELRLEIAGTISETFFQHGWECEFEPRPDGNPHQRPKVWLGRAVNLAEHLAERCGIEGADLEHWAVTETKIIAPLMAHHVEGTRALAWTIAVNSISESPLGMADVRATLGDHAIYRLRREWKELVVKSLLPR